MGTLILLSSSPPRSFARSPTPAASSSPLFASPSSMFGNAHKEFKNCALHRDGFQGGSYGARRILGTRVSSENIPFGVTKSQYTLEKAAKELPTNLKSLTHLQGDGRNLEHKYSTGLSTAEASMKDLGERQSTVSAAVEGSGNNGHDSIFVTKTDGRPDSRALSPLLLDKALPRRLDWTPAKRSSGGVIDLEPEAGPLRDSFSGGLLQSFGYERASAQSLFRSNNKEDAAPTKRRRLDLAETSICKPPNIAVVPGLVPTSKNSTTTTKRRSKSPKKYTTITGLATSHYFGEEQRDLEASPVLQNLAGTQVRDGRDSEKSLVETTKRKRAPRKPKAKKKSLPISVLLSPESAMKAIDSQDTVFGSASQLAQDESPEFIRDIMDAIKQSESSTSCTPAPTQITILSEPGSGGASGTSRFIKSRNLWANASRDEDNALLQVDTVDMFDSPGLRLAFTGKDAMLEPTAPWQRESASPEKVLTVLQVGHLEQAEDGKSNSWLDIDDIGIPTPRACVVRKPFAQTRTIHTASGRPCERDKSLLQDNDKPTTKRNSSTGEHKQKVGKSDSDAASKSTGPLGVQMPVFAGFTTADLSNQIKKYGFKPFKKREKMIEVLENCWKAQHKPNDLSTDNVDSVVVLDEEPEFATHGDILSNVHSLAARPLPKVPKRKALKRSKETPASPANPGRRKAAIKDGQDVENNLKQRKKSEPKAKKPRETTSEEIVERRKAKAPAPSVEYVIDISDIEDSKIENSDMKPKLVAAATATVCPNTAVQSPVRFGISLPVLTSTTTSRVDSVTSRPPEMLISELPDINSQITNAIVSFVPSPSRDHQRHPTWHEKILMYDPIVLEDLAAWLNTEGFRLIGEDREISALEVRAWCEMKGVCCYGVGGGWRGNVKGKAGANSGEIDD